jgi:hypothetical protein
LMKKAQSLDDPVIEIHQLRLAQRVYVDPHLLLDHVRASAISGKIANSMASDSPSPNLPAGSDPRSARS